MSPTRRTHILFDFFGTLVDYSASRTEQGYPRSHHLIRDWGSRLDYLEFLTRWGRTFAEFDLSSDRDNHEFSMPDVAGAFLAGALGRPAGAGEVRGFVTTYIAEWNRGVRYPPGIADLVTGLAADYRLAVVTNTHHASLVPDHLAAMGLTASFDAVITSVEVGWRKPHPKIYSTVLAELGITAEAAVFVGDTYEPDFVGPEHAGIPAFLIDPAGLTPVPRSRRLSSIFDLPDRLARTVDVG